MNFKTTYILFGTLLIVIAIFGLTQMRGVKGDETFVFPSMHERGKEVTQTKITKLVVAPKDGPQLVFERISSDAPWKLVSPYSTRVDSMQVNNLVDSVIRLRREDVSDTLARNLAHHGLEPPKATITLHQGTEKEWKLGLGDSSIGTGRSQFQYVTASDRPGEPLAVRKQDLDAATKTAKDFREKGLLLESVLNALNIDLSDGQRELELAKLDEAGKDNVWQFKKPAHGEADYHGDQAQMPPPGVPTTRVNSVRDLLTMVEQLKVAYNAEQKIDDFVAENVPDKDLAEKYGLTQGKPATLRVEIKSRTGNLLGGDKKSEPVTDALLIGKKVPGEAKKEEKQDEPKKDDKKDEAKKDEPKKDEPKSSDEDYYYARLESESNVVKLPAKSIKPLLDVLGNTSVLRNKDLVQFEPSKVDAIDVQNAGGEVKLRKVGEPAKWKLLDGDKFRDVDQSSVTKLLNVLNTRRQVRDFPTKDEKELGLVDSKNEIKLWVDGIKDKKDDKNAPKLERETIKLTFGAKNNEVVYVKRQQGKDALTVAVPEGLIDRVTDGKLAYLDKTLPLFKTDDEVTKVVLTQPDGVFELEREKKDDKVTWIIRKPAEQAGRTADRGKVEQMIDMLRNLHTDKLISEKAGDPELNGYRLSPPDYQAMLTLKKGDKSEDRVFQFGRETDKKDGRYAKQGERDLVFVVRPEVIEPLKAKDLANMEIFTFDPKKVKELKLSGWIAAEKRLTTLPLEFKEPKEGEPKTWEIKEADKKNWQGFNLDATKVANLVQDLSKLSATRFLVFKAGPKADHKLDEKSRELEIEIVLDGEKEPLTLTLGALVGEGNDKGYAAQSSALKGDVFVLPESRFDKLLKEGSKYFSK
ncbi:MAG: DUF4340 domain-containing protein [Planctomycetia bacterium]|nr:DUF4340 domain-containing protein [Planctomycetia bacterium]